MDARVKRIDILETELPFKRPFRHAHCTRHTSNTVFVKVYLEDGVAGYGEALPREYVTGETTKSVSRKLHRVLPRTIIGARFKSFKKGVEFVSKLRTLDGTARCSVEIALLDALGKHFGVSVSSIIGGPIRKSVFASAVISADSPASVIKTAMAIKAFGFKAAKVKVGLGDDLKRLELVRKILGSKVDLRVDANCAWDSEEAIKKIEEMRKFRISAVEQPVKPEDIRGLKKVTDSVQEAIIADEALSTVKDAERLANAKMRSCDMFNIRLSKCGGILNALKIADIARRNSIKYQLGCQVGESGVLSAAGRHFACGIENIAYYEGSYGRFLLKEDVTKEDMGFGFGGRAPALAGPGLGVTVSDRVLEKYKVSHFILE